MVILGQKIPKGYVFLLQTGTEIKLIGAIVGNAVASRLGDHNGFQYVVDVEDSDDDISIVQSGEEQIPIGSKVTVSIGTNTRIIISE